jgi:ribosomal protein S18 acetylase RimI-like enzyme
MSCNAHHGKLHDSQSHIGQLLLAHGFCLEHENVYYVLDNACTGPVENSPLRFGSIAGSSEKKFEIRSDAKVVGTAHVRHLDTLTDGYSRDTAYLTWIGVAEQHRHQGIGTELLKRLSLFLLGRRYRYLHTDTAARNLRAQQFYEKLGFRKHGYTRSYVQA